MKLKNLKLGIKGKILIPVLLISAIVCGSMGTFMAQRMRNTTTELAAEQALMAARFASASVSPTDLVGLVSGDESGEQFQRAATALDHARNQVGFCTLIRLRPTVPTSITVLTPTRKKPSAVFLKKIMPSFPPLLPARKFWIKPSTIPKTVS